MPQPTTVPCSECQLADYPFISTAFPYINKTGTTQFRLRFKLDDDNDNVADYMKFYSGNYATASYRPVLIIQYHVP